MEALGRDLGCQPSTAAVLANRGHVDADAARRFLKPAFGDLPDPRLLKDMDRAVEVVVRAIRERRKIVCHGDYDVDGVSGSAVLVEFLRLAGAEVAPFIPDRRLHGYGFTRASLEECEKLGAKVIITCDCGTASVAEVAEARERGIEVVITDHHEPGPELPKAAALLNPKQPGETFPDSNLCGTGVAFFLVIALRRALREIGWFGELRPEPNLRAMLDIVTMATIGDIVPLTGINRIFTREGLPMLAAGVRPGIAALREVAGAREFTESTVSFALVPRVNAAGRLGSAATALHLLLTKDRDEARRLAALLDGENKKRQDIEAGMLEEALAMAAADPRLTAGPAIVLASDRWHMGVVGIIAARLVDRFHRPSIALAIDPTPDAKGRRMARGSARSIRRFNVFDALCACQDHLRGFGGHAAAAGMTVDEDAIPALRAAFTAEAARKLSADDLLWELSIDAVVDGSMMTERLFDELTSLGPHGLANPEPLLLLQAARVTGSRVVGNGHLRLDLAGTSGRGRIGAFGFGLGASHGRLGESVDVAFVPQRREWMGLTSSELKIRDLGLGEIERQL